MIVHHHRMILRRSDRRRGGDDLLERLHVGNGKDADARRLDDGDGVEILVALPRDHGKPSSVIAPTRKNHALGEAARLLRVRKLLNRRYASI